MQQERGKIMEELKRIIEIIKQEEPHIGEAVGQILLTNLAEGRVEKFMRSGTSDTVEEYCVRVLKYYKAHHDFIRKIQAEDSMAWEELLDKLLKWAYTFIRKKGVPVQADRFQIAEDCANEAGARLANLRFPFDVHYDSWACRVTQNVCLNYIRRHTDKVEYAYLEISEVDDWLRAFSSPESATIIPMELELSESSAWLASFVKRDVTNSSETRIDLLKAIDQLQTEERKSLILLHYFEGKDFNEIAKILDRTKNALYKLHFDALENLRKILHEEGNSKVEVYN